MAEYLKRKVDTYLDEWLKNGDCPALIKGIRQCGKTESIRNFGKRNFKNIIELNFWNNPEYKKIFEKDLDVNRIINNISLNFPNEKIIPGQTLIFFDEIQDCPKARLSFKNFAQDKRYKIVGSGSYLGINGYVLGDATPVPVGYEEIYTMKTMDFEEFLWANGYTQEHIAILENCFNNHEAIPQSTHLLFKKLFNEYMCVGGFPKAVKKFINTGKILEGTKKVLEVIADMKNDFGRKINRYGLPVFSSGDVNRINQAFDLIPTFISKDNKRFITSKILTGTSEAKVNAIEYLKDAGVVYKVHNLELPSLPLAANKIQSQFKLFVTDIGIMTTLLGQEAINSVYNNNLGIAKGALYEALVFDSLYKAGINTFYYSKESGLEIDFVICYKNNACLVEAKAKTGNTKSSKTVMSHPEHYGKTNLIKIGDYNIGLKDNILTIPHYLTFLLGK